MNLFSCLQLQNWLVKPVPLLPEASSHCSTQLPSPLKPLRVSSLRSPAIGNHFQQALYTGNKSLSLKAFKVPHVMSKSKPAELNVNSLSLSKEEVKLSQNAFQACWTMRSCAVTANMCI